MSDTFRPGQPLVMHDGTTTQFARFATTADAREFDCQPRDVILYGTADHDGETHVIPRGQTAEYLRDARPDLAPLTAALSRTPEHRAAFAGPLGIIAAARSGITDPDRLRAASRAARKQS